MLIRTQREGSREIAESSGICKGLRSCPGGTGVGGSQGGVLPKGKGGVVGCRVGGLVGAESASLKRWCRVRESDKRPGQGNLRTEGRAAWFMLLREGVVSPRRPSLLYFILTLFSQKPDLTSWVLQWRSHSQTSASSPL